MQCGREIRFSAAPYHQQRASFRIELSRERRLYSRHLECAGNPAFVVQIQMHEAGALRREAVRGRKKAVVRAADRNKWRREKARAVRVRKSPDHTFGKCPHL